MPSTLMLAERTDYALLTVAGVLSRLAVLADSDAELKSPPTMATLARFAEVAIRGGRLRVVVP